MGENIMPDTNNPHAGHRKRMMRKYLEHGMEGFDEYEKLEIFLYAAYNRRNTADISRMLIDKYGSIKGVLDMEYEDLLKEDLVGESAAALISFMRDFAREYVKVTIPGLRIQSTEDMRQYFFELLRHSEKEEAHAVFLDKTMNVISEANVTALEAGEVNFNMNSIMRYAVGTQCSNIVIAHNHLSGLILPSSGDIAETRRIHNSLVNVGIKLLDHIVVSCDGCYSMQEAHLLPDLW